MMVVGVLGMFYLFFRLEFFQLGWLAASGLISLAYAFPFIPSSKGKLSLRLIPGLKLWAIVFVWSISCAILPLLGNGFEMRLILLFTLLQASFVTALTIPFDIRDLPVDYPFQKTLPQVFGIKTSKKIALAFLGLSAAASYGAFNLGMAGLELILLHIMVLTISAILVYKAGTESHRLFFTIAIDGMLILQGALFILAEYYI